MYFGIFKFWKITEWRHFVTYLWNDPRSSQSCSTADHPQAKTLPPNRLARRAIFFWKLALTRISDPIRPTRQGHDPNRPTRRAILRSRLSVHVWCGPIRSDAVVSRIICVVQPHLNDSRSTAYKICYVRPPLHPNHNNSPLRPSQFRCSWFSAWNSLPVFLCDFSLLRGLESFSTPTEDRSFTRCLHWLAVWPVFYPDPNHWGEIKTAGGSFYPDPNHWGKLRLLGGGSTTEIERRDRDAKGVEEVWLSGTALVSINVVTLRRARLVPGWVTAFGRVNYLGM